MLKKLILLLLVFVLLAFPFSTAVSAANNEAVVSTKPVIFDTKGYDFKFDFRALTIGDNTRYSDEISILSSLLSTDFCEDGDIVITEKDQNIMEQMGFDDIETIDMRHLFSQDADDFVVFRIGRRTIEVDGKEFVVYALAVRGTVLPEEWASDFDVGADTDNYYRMTGSHDQWCHSDQHKGFDVTANRVNERIQQYINRFKTEDEGKESSILITGHSRGAAVTNILGKYFEDNYRQGISSIRPYTYTFGTPTTTVLEKDVTEQYKTIFNILNEDDLVTYVPLTTWGFGRYGKDIGLSVEKEGDLKTLWKEDGIGDMFVHFMAAYIKLLYNSVRENENQLTEKDLSLYKLDYQSAEGDQVAAILSELFPGDDEKIAASRDKLYECTDMVWIPEDIPSDYEPYYVPAPYEQEITDPEEKEQYDRFAQVYQCKRVKICPAFSIHAICNILDEITGGGENALNLQIVEKEMAEIKAAGDTGSVDKDRISSLEYDNLKALLYVPFIRMDDSKENGERYANSLFDLAQTNILIGLAYSHMPTTYYFMVNQMAISNPSSNFEKKDSCRVDFNANGHGTAPDSQYVLYGNKATEPAAPAASGCEFGGWYKDSACTESQKYDFNTSVTSDLILYAKWTKHSFKTSVKKGVKTYICKTCGYMKTETLKVTVPKTSIKSIKKGEKAFTVKWKKKPVSGYQIQYASSSKFTKGKKTIKVTGAAAVSKKICKLKAKKKYYVRVRCYTSKYGRIYYSGWSAKKAVLAK